LPILFFWFFSFWDGPEPSQKQKMTSRCGKCDAPATKKCGRCKQRVYCSSKCQIEDWKSHKMVCCAPAAQNERGGWKQAAKSHLLKYLASDLIPIVMGYASAFHGDFLWSWVRPRGSEDGALKEPRGLTCHQDELIVCDTGNRRLQVFHAVTGRFLRASSPVHLGAGPESAAVWQDHIWFLCASGLYKVTLANLSGQQAPFAPWKKFWMGEIRSSTEWLVWGERGRSFGMVATHSSGQEINSGSHCSRFCLDDDHLFGVDWYHRENNLAMWDLKHPTAKPERYFTLPFTMYDQFVFTMYDRFVCSGQQLIFGNDQETRVRCFDLELSIVRDFDVGPIQYNGLAMSSSGHLYVIDTRSSGVKVYE
jgi:hypothetical protein